MARKATVTIVSVYPFELPHKKGISCEAERHYGPKKGQGYAIFELPTAPREGHSTLVVEDCWQRVYMGENIGYRPQIIEATEIAQDLLTNWVSRRVGSGDGLGPGIGIIQGETPTKEELQALRAQQEAYFSRLVSLARQHSRENHPDRITDEMRAAGKWLGLSKDEDRWIDPIEVQASLVPCPYCYSRINSMATVCPVCTRDVNAKMPQAATSK